MSSPEEIGHTHRRCLTLAQDFDRKLKKKNSYHSSIMSSTVKNLTVTCNPPKDSDAFTVGDWVTGVVNLEVVKECHIESLSIKFKGKAEVLWTERHGNTTHVYHSKDKYFSIKHFFVRHHNSEGKLTFTLAFCILCMNHTHARGFN